LTLIESESLFAEEMSA